MIELFFFENEAEAIEAARVLEKMGAREKKLLGECIEHQILTRKSVSEAAKALEREGFISIRESDNFIDKPFQFTPSLSGEEAMSVLELLTNH